MQGGGAGMPYIHCVDDPEISVTFHPPWILCTAALTDCYYFSP